MIATRVTGLVVVVLLAIVPGAGPSAAVARGADGEGSALIAPMWSVRGGHDSLVSLRNNGDGATVAKLRLIEADGVEVLSLNVYLDARDTWVAALTNAGSDEAPDDRLITGDRTCVLPAPARDAAGVARIELPPLAHGHGYLEIVEMGRNGQGLVGGVPLTWPGGCDALAQRFDSGDWRDDPSAGLIPPLGRLSASVQLINVGIGGMVSPEATALTGFSDIVQHTPPGSEVPNLSTAHTAGTGAGRTESRVCDAAGCRVYGWDLAVEAVASVLAAERFEASYTTNPAIGAVAAFVYTRPLARFEGFDFAIDSDALVAARSRDAFEFISTVCIPQPFVVCGTRYSRLLWSRPVVVVQLGETAAGAAGHSILGTAGAAGGPLLEGLESGEFQLRLPQDPDDGDRVLTSNDGQTVRGDAVVGFVVQQFSNGTVQTPLGEPVLANYRVAEALIRPAPSLSVTGEE